MIPALTDQSEAEAAGGVLTIDLAAVRANYARLAAVVAPARSGAVVKADAYGIGATTVAPELHAAGCRDFFVAHLSEGLCLVPALPPDRVVYLLNGLQPGTEDACADAGLVPVLNSLSQIKSWAGAASRRKARLPAALQLDTGMSRLGLSPEEIQDTASCRDLLRSLDVCLVMSHLACADEPEHPANASQLRMLEALLVHAPRARVSFANSGGAMLGRRFHHDLVRPGIALYGVGPAPGRGDGLEPVVRLEAKVIQVRRIPAAATVGYGASFVAERSMRVATIAVGYADGWPRHLSGRGAAYLGGQRLPILGRVSMDSMTLDVSGVPEGGLAFGSRVELIGPHQTLDDVARDASTIPYEILTRLGRRYARRYVGAFAGGASTQAEQCACG